MTDRGGKTPENQEDLPTCDGEEICESRGSSGGDNQEVSHESNRNSEEGPSNSSGDSCSSGKGSLSIDLLQNSVKDGKVRKRGMRSEGK
ncbi:hypothetical protein [Candidatus Wolbachia massiliensis]|uniref:Uncharacterized protein n=1 Tax=Candidatus Wolbachia massiliensis TaxID=1845000 RepID=A0A7M3U2A7_9RICK|nr:hypothetical protein [Candidatus Wolbachia massiliensis]QOD38542.1 hypothetical protein ID128_01445 [Candidatus Wolbachia massiliensis]